MSHQSATHSHFTLTRTIQAAPAAVFRAFADPDLKRRWYAEGDQLEVEAFSADLREGATERLRYRFRDGTPFAGLVIASEDVVMNIVPDSRIVWASKMAFAGNIISAALITAELAPAGAATELTLTFQGAFFEGADGPEIREMGWSVLLDRLAAAIG